MTLSPATPDQPLEFEPLTSPATIGIGISEHHAPAASTDDDASDNDFDDFDEDDFDDEFDDDFEEEFEDEYEADEDDGFADLPDDFQGNFGPTKDKEKKDEEGE